MKLIMFIELCKISKLVMHLNSCSMDLGRDIGHLHQGINSILETFNCWKIQHLKRDYNKVAHELASYARCNGTYQVWKGIDPPMVQHLLQLEHA